MEENLTFKTVISLKGHDLKRRYVVVAMACEDFALLCDGRYRKLDNPKLKRVKHLRIDGDSGLNKESLTNEKIKRALKAD